MQPSMDSMESVLNMRVGRYHNRKFMHTVLPKLASKIQKPLVYGHVVSILEKQGFYLDPDTDNKSVYDPQQLFGALARYSQHSTDAQAIDARCLRAALNEARSLFGRPKGVSNMLPLQLNQVVNVVHATHSSGAPEFVAKGDAVQRDLIRAQNVLKGLRKPDPCVSFHRVSHGSTGPKVRLVWGYPQSMSLIEGMFAYPLIEHFLHWVSPIAFGLRLRHVAARTLPIRNHAYVYGLDYSKFDASVPPFLIREAFRILRSWFDPVWKRYFDVIEEYFIHTRIVMPDGNLYIKHKGVPSGSWFTNLIDSVVNYIALQYAMLRVNGKMLNGKTNVLVMGDDSVFGLPHPLNLKAFESAVHELGLNLNLEKSFVSSNPGMAHFIGREWRQGGIHRPMLEIAKRAAFPERYDYEKNVSGLQRLAEYRADCEEGDVLYLRSLLAEKKPFTKDSAALSSYAREPRTTGFVEFARRETRDTRKFTRIEWEFLLGYV